MERASDGLIYVGGEGLALSDGTSGSVFRMHPDGSFDEAFRLDTDLRGTVTKISVLSNHIYVAGYFHSSENAPIHVEHLARLRLDGSIDASFDTGVGPNGSVNNILPLDDGSLLVGGDFTRYNNESAGWLIKVQHDGALDSEFDSQIGPAPNLRSLALQSDGGIIFGGRFSRLHGQQLSYLARLHRDGSLDSRWVSALDGSVDHIQVTDDDKLYIAGSFITVDGQARPGLARLHADGRLDEEFVPQEGIRTLNQMRLLDDGILVVSGRFDLYGGESVPDLIGLNPDGRLSDAFMSQLKLPRQSLGIQNFVVDDDGGLVVSGYFKDEDRMILSSIVRISPDNPARTTIGFLGEDFQVMESGRGLNIELNRIGDVSRESRVRWTVPDSTGARESDFPEQQGEVVFAPLERRQMIHLEILDDLIAESDELVTIHLEVLSAGNVIGYSDASVRILDNDRIGTLNDSFWTNIQRSGGRYGYPFYDETDGFLRNSLSGRGFGFGFVGSRVGLVEQVFVGDGDQLLIRGDFDFVNEQAIQNIALLEVDGSLDSSFLPVLDRSALRWIELQSSGQIIVLGNEEDGTLLLRLNPDGSRDQGFAEVLRDEVEHIEGFRLLSDDRILFWGHFSSFRGETRINLVVLSPNGDIDESFVPELESRTELSQAVVLPGDRILIGGTIRFVDGGRPVFMAQLTADGQLDPAYDLGSGPNRRVYGIAPFDREHIHITGDFSRIGMKRIQYQGWVNANGQATDPPFDLLGSPNYERVQHQLGERFFLPGHYDLDGESIDGLGVLRPDGTKDPSFDFGNGINGTVRTVAFASNGDAFLGGDFTSFNGIEVGGLVRVNGEYLFSIEEIEQHPDGTLSFWIPSIPGESYALESSVDMLNWVEVEQHTAMQHRLGLFDPVPGGQRFYRVRHRSAEF